VGGSALFKIEACLFQALLPVHGQADFRRVGVFLAIVFPPANRAQAHGVWRLQRSESAAGTAESVFSCFHV
jgi:hypothetical protein